MTGRPKAEPFTTTLIEWRDAGCPPLLLSVAQVAVWAKVSIMMVNTYCKKGVLFRHDSPPNKSKIPTDDPKNMEWLLDRVGYEPRELRTGGKPTHAANQPAAPAATRTMKYPLTAPPPPPPPPGDRMPPAEQHGPGEDMLNLEQILHALETLDLTKISAAGVQKVARLETALKTRADRMAKRGQLIDRALVSTVFNRLYQIDSNELKTIGAKVAPDVGAELGVEDPETLLRIEKRIEDEILKVLAHIKRTLDDFLRGVDAEPIEDIV